MTGEDVLLKTRPVDPRDLFRGDYVILSYEINSLNVDTLVGDNSFNVGDTIYVDLSENGTYYDAIGVYKTPIDSLYIKGEVTSLRSSRISVVYGVESYFVPEGTGRQIERQPDLDVMLAVDSRGRSAIQYVMIDGEIIDLKYDANVAKSGSNLFW